MEIESFSSTRPRSREVVIERERDGLSETLAFYCFSLSGEESVFSLGKNYGISSKASILNKGVLRNKK